MNLFNYSKIPSFLKLPLSLTIIFAFYLIFLLTPRYESDMIIKVTTDTKSSINFNVPVIGAGLNEEIEELKEFLESDEGTNELIDNLSNSNRFPSLLRPYFVDFYSKGFMFDLKDQLERFVDIEKDSDLNGLKVTTTGFNKIEPYIINTAIILTANDYFNEQNLLMGIMESANNLCNLAKEQIDYSEVIVEISDDLNSITGLRAILRNFGEKNITRCLDKITTNPSENNSFYGFPEKTMLSLDANFQENAIREIFSSLKKIQLSEQKIKIISKPEIPNEEVEKRFLLSTFLCFISLIVLYASFTISLKIFREYN
tara:strand:+ start:6 stop:947 length:942 start_codon:yes stop_codon:yes gene_type:complete